MDRVKEEDDGMSNLIDISTVSKTAKVSDQHIHTVMPRIHLDSDNYLIIANYCVECGKRIDGRRVKTEPLEVTE